MCEKCVRICNAIGELNSAGHDVTLCADKDGCASMVDIRFDGGEITGAFYGDSVVAALENAVEWVRSQSGG